MSIHSAPISPLAGEEAQAEAGPRRVDFRMNERSFINECPFIDEKMNHVS
jgi:hypothetical protein